MKSSSGLLAGFLAAVVVATGVAAAGWFVKKGIVEQRVVENFVTVKGLSEREAKADLAVWPITLTQAGNDLTAVSSAIDADIETTRQWLVSKGFAADDIALGRVQVEDRVAQGYGREYTQNGRYSIRQPLTIRSTNVDLVDRTSRQLGELVREGIVMNDWQGPTYTFTGLNAIKNEMIAEATANALASAEQFATDANAVVGGLRTANQGVFQILPRDEAAGFEGEQIFKTVRVVSTFTYYLK